MRARSKVGFVLAVLLASARASADPAPPTVITPTTILVFSAPRQICRPGALPADPPTCRDIPPGRYYDATSWDKIDAELRRLQDAETRLGAENKSLRATAASWQPGWKTLGAATLSGFLGGITAFHYFAR